MKLVLHIVTKDARRLWPAVVLWAFLFTAHLFSDWRAAHADTADAELLAELKFFKILFFVIQLLSTYVFAATLVLEDSPIGSSTFWATRPISGARLLMAKIVSCLLWFIVLAMLVSVPWWMVSQREQRDWVLEALALFRWQAWTAGAAVVIAAFTGGLGRFLLASLGVVFVTTIVMLMQRPGILAADSLRWLAVIAAIALWVHYQTRRTRLAFVILTMGALSSATVYLASGS